MQKFVAKAMPASAADLASPAFVARLISSAKNRTCRAYHSTQFWSAVIGTRQVDGKPAAFIVVMAQSIIAADSSRRTAAVIWRATSSMPCQVPAFRCGTHSITFVFVSLDIGGRLCRARRLAVHDSRHAD